MLSGSEIALRIDQTLTQDATGTLVMLELVAMGLDRVRTEVSAQYVDHNLVQEDHKNPDDHGSRRNQHAPSLGGLHRTHEGSPNSGATHAQPHALTALARVSGTTITYPPIAPLLPFV